MPTLLADCRSAMPDVRDQGDRPTCLAFALSDVHAAIRKVDHPWSAEYLYYHGVQRMPARDPEDGLTVAVGKDALLIDGQPPEAAWPYLPSLPKPLSLWKPPSVSGVAHARADVGTPNINAIRMALDSGRPTVLGVAISRAFVSAGPDGLLPKLAVDDFCGLHAIVAVGHGSVSGAPAVLIRNSWGLGWADAGHAWLLDTYLSPRLRSVTLLARHP